MYTRAIIIWVIIIDFVVKGIVRQGLLKPSIKLNEGLAFSISSPVFVSILVTTAILVVLFLYYKKIKKTLTLTQEAAFGLILGGALSNLLERVYSGYVTDFIHIGSGVLNLADLAIITGLFLLILLSIKNQKLTIKDGN